MFKRLSITASRDFMQNSHDYSSLLILIRMRGLRLLRSILKAEEPGHGLRYSDNEREGPESNGRRFMELVHGEFTHVKEVTVEGSTAVDYTTGDGVALPRVMSALGERIKGWEVPKLMVQIFWGGGFTGRYGRF
ncbi:hypothetical protein HO133_002560 [Letharia lupina]|uniref:Uncharacterized protein n=1 Tax=Letharia lupina TaxID=560253 RepID=A0A8H6FA60_9LECA|nr:uncharacterized protein HO133_002560 [Letharia lupina]KAF6220880.1 hypothetical protein HO133_002560 [Letharia lupina]